MVIESYFPQSLIRYTPLFILIISSLLGFHLYASPDYSNFTIAFWFFSIFFTGIYFYLKREKINKKIFNRKDVFIAIGIFAFFAPFYLTYLYYIPFQINTDEIVIMSTIKSFANASYLDLFSISNYFQFPAFVFIVFGWLGELFGGITLIHMRTIHALFGLAIIFCSYFLFRLFFSNFWAFGATLILGSNHALFAISRMAMRDNTGLLVVIIGLLFFLWGFNQRNILLTYFSGIFAGFGFYFYEPGRITIFLYGLFIIILLLIQGKYQAKQILKFSFSILLGFILITAPLFFSIFNQYSDIGFPYQKQQLLIFPEGRALQQSWGYVDSHIDGLKNNYLRGLKTFISRDYDAGYIYPNYGNGFLDPATQIFLHVGLFISLFLIFIKRKIDNKDFFMLFAFVSLWLIFSFILTKAPHYTRLLIVLPFVAYFAIRGIQKISYFTVRLLRINSKTQKIVASLFLVIIFILNGFIFSDFVKVGNKKGDSVGGTARYVEKKSAENYHNFYIIADEYYPYYSWGIETYWEDWLSFFIAPTQNAKILSPNEIDMLDNKEDFTVFFSRLLWETKKEEISRNLSNPIIHNITPDGRLIAIESHK